MLECIRAQATRVETEGCFPPGLSGPAFANDADVLLGEVVVAENDVPMVHEAESCARAHVAGENEADERAKPLADLQFAACDLSTADLDVERATHEFSERLERLYSHLKTRKNASARDEGTTYKIESEINSLQRLAKTMSSVEFISHMEFCTEQAEGPARGEFTAVKGKDGFILSTSKVPLSMYSEKILHMSFPYLFPYGDGVLDCKDRHPYRFANGHACYSCALSSCIKSILNICSLLSTPAPAVVFALSWQEAFLLAHSATEPIKVIPSHRPSLDGQLILTFVALFLTRGGAWKCSGALVRTCAAKDTIPQ